MNKRAIIDAYNANEDAARRTVPGNFLLMDDVKLCVEMAAEECGVTYEEARSVMIEEWAGTMGAG